VPLIFAHFYKVPYERKMLIQHEKISEKLAWFDPGWQPQAQLGDGNAPKAVQPSPNLLDLRLPPIIELQINVTRNLPYLNHAEKLYILW